MRTIICLCVLLFCTVCAQAADKPAKKKTYKNEERGLVVVDKNRDSYKAVRPHRQRG